MAEQRTENVWLAIGGRASTVVFAMTMATLGVTGLKTSDFTAIWTPVSLVEPGRTALVYVCASICLIGGMGLLWQRTAAFAARLLFAYLLVWWLILKMLELFRAPKSQDSWSGWGETAVLVAAAWVLYAWVAAGWDKRRLGFATGEKGLRWARVLYGLAILPFGVAHFTYAKETAGLVPGWLPWHFGWAYFFGVTFLAAGVAVLFGIFARLAASLAAAQIGIFTVLVWLPIVAAGSKNPFVWSETVISWTLTAAAWVVADSYRDMPWLAVNRR
jgi:uncharacterized membrane protein